MNAQTRIALIAFVLLGVGAFVVLRAPEKGERSATNKPKTPAGVATMTKENIDELEVTSDKQKTVLKRDPNAKEGAEWKVVSPVTYPADQEVVKSAVDKLSSLAWKDVISDKKERAVEFEVDDAKGAHIIARGGGKTLADIYFGKEANGATLVRPAGQDAIWQVEGVLKWVFSRDTKGWRDKSILEVKRDDLETVTIDAASKGKTVLKRVPSAPTAKAEGAKPPVEAMPGVDKIEVVESSVPVTKLDENMAQGVVSGVYQIKAADFADGSKLEETGLDKPGYSVTVKAAGKTHTLLIGKPKAEMTYVKLADEPQIFLVPKYNADRLSIPPVDFRDKTIIEAKDEDIQAVSINFGGETTEIERKGAKGQQGESEWQAKKPKGLAIDPANVAGVIGTFASFKGGAFADTTDGAATGLSTPSATVKVTTKDKKTTTIVVGKAQGDDYYVKHGNEVFMVKKYLVERFLKKPNDFKKSDAVAGRPQLPPGMQLPPGVQLPPGMQVPQQQQ